METDLLKLSCGRISILFHCGKLSADKCYLEVHCIESMNHQCVLAFFLHLFKPPPNNSIIFVSPIWVKLTEVYCIRYCCALRLQLGDQLKEIDYKIIKFW